MSLSIVAGITLKSLGPRVWDQPSDHYLPGLQAVMLSYADFHRMPAQRRRAMERGIHAHLGIPADVQVYLDNGAFYFLGQADEADAAPGAVTAGSVGGNEPDTIAASLPPREQMEREANRFAGELLMPAAVVRGLAEQYEDLGEKDLVWRLAAEMLVSQAAMRLRLKELGLLTPETEAVN